MARPFTLSPNYTVHNQDDTWSGIKVDPLFNPKLSLGQILANALARYSFQVGQLCHEDGHEMRNHEILRNSVRVCLRFRDMGLKEGETIGFACGNSRYASQVVLGGLLSGNPINTLDPSFEFSDVVHMFGITKPKVVFCDTVNCYQVKRALAELKSTAPVFVVDQWDDSEPDTGVKSLMELLAPHPQENVYIPPTISDPENTPALIVCSSGSTGSPKAIPISHAAFAYMFQSPFQCPPNTSVFSFSTFYWFSGISTLLMAAMNGLKRIIVQKPFNAQLLLDIIKTRQLSFLICTPAQVQLLIIEGFDHDDLKSLMTIMCGGSALPPTLQEKFKVPLMTSYGLTEACAGVSVSGQLVAGVTVKIVNESGKKLTVGDRGEICVKPLFPFLGYYGNEEATNDMLKEDGFLYTGDIGLFDEQGNLHVVDRKKEIFKYNNFHINPTDVEKVLQEMENVGAISVVGIPHPIYASLPAALIIQKPGSRLSEKDVHEFAKANLPQYKFLRGGVYFVDQLPMTASGKIMRAKATKIAEKLYAERPEIGFEY